MNTLPTDLQEINNMNLLMGDLCRAVKDLGYKIDSFRFDGDGKDTILSYLIYPKSKIEDYIIDIFGATVEKSNYTPIAKIYQNKIIPTFTEEQFHSIYESTMERIIRCCPDLLPTNEHGCSTMFPEYLYKKENGKDGEYGMILYSDEDPTIPKIYLKLCPVFWDGPIPKFATAEITTKDDPLFSEQNFLIWFNPEEY